MSGLLKRKFEEVDEDPCYSSPSPSSLSSACSGWDSEVESCYSDTLDSTSSNPSSPATNFNTTSILKKAKRPRRGNVTFDQVTVFFFPRCQGFTSVPSRGGCTLGMMQRHSALRTYTLAEFAVEQQLLRREKVLNRLREEKLEALKLKLTKNGTQESEEAEQLTVDDIPEQDIDINGAKLDEGSFLHPYPSKHRYALLKAAGVKKIDKEEKRQLHELRISRENCGCDCQGFCEPETCSCSIAGIKCQMDHSSFPCGCTKDGCGNTEGRIEFNSTRVQTHYIHTIMKLELEKRLEEQSGTEEEENTTEAASPPAVPSFHFSSELVAAAENSCSSDMTDFSDSSGHSDDSETGESPCKHHAQLDVYEKGLNRILSLNDTENCSRSSRDGRENNSKDTCCAHQQQQQQQQQQSTEAFSSFSMVDFADENDNIDAALLDSADDHTDNQVTAISELLDENANQGNALFHCGSVPQTPSPTIDRLASYNMDLSLSSESDLEFFDGFPCLGPSSLYNSLKEYEHMDNFFQFQLPNHPSLPAACDPETCLLESLIGLSESTPDPPATLTDNQLLEEAMKLSVMEPVKV
ncbi:cysteine/serine-rich nuclear protein 1b [Mastacembelus armatus]|uniref:Cysteine-serine-rich nuclear protein 1b n=1 Tax=Mastacembelus armatus TaxID=205130 RepID=A0A3Q3L1F2_9TELE|nr:cysteine/serine-rich nuclear protein 1-like [Mastacembelus armatus]XP_026147796.1 cysteine/serine-rich nuclear protein 1-like [Mastacembelus armatus]